MREKVNYGTFAAQPSTLAAMSALPISINFVSINADPSDALNIRKQMFG